LLTSADGVYERSLGGVEGFGKVVQPAQQQQQQRQLSEWVAAAKLYI
jgi:hypothetical protein